MYAASVGLLFFVHQCKTKSSTAVPTESNHTVCLLVVIFLETKGDMSLLFLMWVVPALDETGVFFEDLVMRIVSLLLMVKKIYETKQQAEDPK